MRIAQRPVDLLIADAAHPLVPLVHLKVGEGLDRGAGLACSTNCVALAVSLTVWLGLGLE